MRGEHGALGADRQGADVRGGALQLDDADLAGAQFAGTRGDLAHLGPDTAEARQPIGLRSRNARRQQQCRAAQLQQGMTDCQSQLHRRPSRFGAARLHAVWTEFSPSG